MSRPARQGFAQKSVEGIKDSNNAEGIDGMERIGGIRFVAVDLDGTVLVEHRGVSERTIAAFRALKARGITPLVATGRPRRSALPWVDRLGVDAGLVCHNGAAVYDGAGKLLAETTIPEKAARRLCIASRAIPIHFHGFAGDEWLYEVARAGTLRYEERSGFKGRQVDFSALPRLGFHKAMFVGTEEEAPALEELLEREFGNGRGGADGGGNGFGTDGSGLEVYATGSGFVELVAPGIGKGSSLAILVSALGGTMAEVLAFGDAWNDLDMLLKAGIGVAMGNAPAAIRERVGRVAPPAAEDGVALWLEALLAGRP
jgi:HAD superfamily hydrolase (TIGR01484 family)